MTARQYFISACIGTDKGGGGTQVGASDIVFLFYFFSSSFPYDMGCILILACMEYWI